MAPDSLEPQRCAELLSALAAPERLRIIRLLSNGPLCVGDIAEQLAIQPVNLSHHLEVLKRSRMIMREKRGRFAFYRLGEGVLEEVIAAGIPKQAIDLGCCVLFMPSDHCETPTVPQDAPPPIST